MSTIDKLSPLLSAGGNLIEGGMNALMQSNANKNQQRYSTYMYDRQRADALKDWNMQNAYNSPAAQMQRFKDAGLNPNLIYGQTNTAPPVRSSSSGGYRPNAPQFNGISGGISAYYQNKMQQASIANINELAEVNKQNAKLKAAQIGATVASTSAMQTMQELNKARTSNVQLNTALMDFNLKKAQDLRATSIGIAEQTLRNMGIQGENMQIQGSMMLSANERANALAANSIAQGIQRIAESRVRTQLMGHSQNEIDARIDLIRKNIDNATKSGEMMQFEINLNKTGATKGDALWQRRLSTAVEKIISGEPIFGDNSYQGWHRSLNSSGRVGGNR